MIDLLTLPNAPAIEGLIFRRFRGESDFSHMAAVITACIEADGIDRVVTVEDIRNNYAHFNHCDPFQDMVFAEINGVVVGYGRCEWTQDDAGLYLYSHLGYVVPHWQRRGLGRTLLRYLEGRLRYTAQTHPVEAPKTIQVSVSGKQVATEALYRSEGYTPIRYGYGMERPDLENILDFPLPAGLEVRPVTPDHYRAIWAADAEAFRDHWGYVAPTETDYDAWLNNPTIFQPHLWKVAWAGDQVAGQVRSFINAAENAKFQRQRGYTEFISVRRPWRKQGVARALIAQSLHALKAAGMTEAALGVDAENPSGAVKIYEDCGFQVKDRSVALRKAL